jgi:hypothetical protein
MQRKTMRTGDVDHGRLGGYGPVAPTQADSDEVVPDVQRDRHLKVVRLKMSTGVSQRTPASSCRIPCWPASVGCGARGQYTQSSSCPCTSLQGFAHGNI